MQGKRVAACAIAAVQYSSLYSTFVILQLQRYEKLDTHECKSILHVQSFCYKIYSVIPACYFYDGTIVKATISFMVKTQMHFARPI